MPIEAIGSYQPSRVNFDPWPPIEPIGKTMRQAVPVEYAEDTIAQAEVAWSKLFPEASAAWRSTVDGSTPRPKLEKPHLEAKSLHGATEEIGTLVAKIGSGEDAEEERQDAPLDKNLAEIALLQLYIQCMKVQQEHAQDDAELLNNLVARRRDENGKLKEEYFNKLDEQIAKKKQSKILAWLSGILWGALALVGIASLALSIATAGVTAPTVIGVVLGLVNATLAIGSGSLTISKGVLDYLSKKMTGVLEGLKFERSMNNEHIKMGMEEMQQSMRVIADSWKEMAKVVNNWLNASMTVSA